MNRNLSKSLFRISMFDYGFAGLILLFSFGSLAKTISSAQTDHKKVVVYQENVKIKEMDIMKDQVFQTDHVTIEVKNGSVRVLHSDCPHKICVHTGRINSSAQTIVCIPNRILIEIEELSEHPGYHAVSY